MAKAPTKEFKSEDGEKYIVIREPMGYGFKKNMENMIRPEKVRHLGEDDVEMFMPDYDPNKDPDILILTEQLVDWSKDEELPEKRSKKKKAIEQDFQLGDLFDQALEHLREYNNLNDNDVVVECPECGEEFEVDTEVMVDSKN